MYGLSFLIFPPQKVLRLSAFFLASIFVPGIAHSNLCLWAGYIASFYIIAALKDKFTEVDKRIRTAILRADIDSLTKANSRGKIIEILDSFISSSSAADLPFSIAFIDVDHLKQLNDTYGHAPGNDALRRIVEVISSGLRDNDMLGRIGGDEFLLLLPDTDTTQA